jgi:hypothetical protein
LSLTAGLETIPLPQPGIEPQYLGCQVHNLITKVYVEYAFPSPVY